jgi:[ribosomal protein S5]-alanine N-acetyltransferase
MIVSNLQFELASTKHHDVFAEWKKFTRLEEQTCRSMIDGKRVIPSNDVVIFAFTIPGIDELVGKFQYFDFNVRNRSAEFGYTVNPKFRQRGIGTKMLITIVDHLFSSTDLNKLYCQTAAFNLASIKLLDKLKFHRDAVLREHHELDKKLWDDYIYSVLRREWKDRKKVSTKLYLF